MKLIDISVFGGELPRLEPRLLQDFQAGEAVNCNLDRRHISPYQGTTQQAALTKAGDIKTIYRFAGDSNPANGFWFHWTDYVDVVQGAIANDTEETTYYTGDSAPKYTYAGIATAGGTDYPMNSYLLGIPIPPATTSVVLTGTPDEGSDATDALLRSYVITYVNHRGEEGAPSLPTTTLSVLPGQNVDLSNIPIAPAGNYNITQKRIYRLYEGEYQFVDTITAATTTYSDTKADTALGDVLSTQEYEPPLSDMHSLGLLPNGIMFGISGKMACFSKPGIPYAWGPLDRQPMPADGVGAAFFGNTVVMLTEKNPVLFTGNDPSSMSQDEIVINQACLSKQSIVGTPYGVVYASPDGLILIGPNGYRNLTENLLTREQWQALDPTTIHGVFHDDRYIGFYDDGSNQWTFVLDPTDLDSGLRFINTHAKFGYADPFSDRLFVLIASAVHRWNDGSSLTARWRTKIYQTNRPKTMTAGRVTANTYANLTFRLFVDGSLKSTNTITNGNVFRLPRGYQGRSFQVEVESTDVITGIELGEVPSDLS